jgi:hypothetical protein
MTIVHMLFALFALANSANADATVDYQQPLPAAFGAPNVDALPAPVADWQQVVYAELSDSPEYAAQMDHAISAASAETGVPPEVIWSVAFTETHGRHWNEAGVVKRGSAGEIGLMQVKPFWGKAIKREYGVDLDLYKLSDNVRAGAYILSRGGEALNVMLSYYNTGRQLRSTAYGRRVMRYLNSLDDLAADAEAQGIGLPQAETPELLATLFPARFDDTQPDDAVMQAAATLAAAESTPSPVQPQPAVQQMPTVLPSVPAPLPAAPRSSDRKLDSRSRGHYDPHQDISWAN